MLFRSDVVMDVSSYPSINDLFKISDILISDYSASIIDYSILERPIICFAYDYDEYKAERGLYIDLDVDMPGGIKTTEDEVLNHILTMDYNAECNNCRELKKRFNEYGGKATQRCVESLFGN